MAKKIELLHTTYDESGNIESQEVVHPLTSPDCIIMENGKTLDEVMGDGIATPTLTHEGTSFKVGVGDSNIEVVDGDVAGMTLKGQSYQNILPKPTTLIMETDEKEFKINDKIDSNIIIDDNIAEIATVKGKTIVNTVQEESASEYTVLGEDLSGQSVVTTNKPEGNIKGVTLQGQTLVNTIQEPCKDDYVVLGADDGIEISAETGGYGTIEDTVQGGINGAVLEGMTLVNLFNTKNIKDRKAENSSAVAGYDASTGTVHYLTNMDRTEPYNYGYISTETGGSEGCAVHDLKPNTTYTVKWFYQRINDVDPSKTFMRVGFSKNQWGSFSGSYVSNVNIENECCTFTTPTEFQEDITRFLALGIINASNTIEYKVQYVILEGDYTNVDIPYFEGMKSVQMPVLKAIGKNLLNPNDVKHYPNGKTTNIFMTNKIKPNTDYIISFDNNGVDWLGSSFYLRRKDNSSEVYIPTKNATSNGRASAHFNFTEEQVAILNNEGYLQLYCTKVPDESLKPSHIQIEESLIATSYEPFKSNILTTSEEVELRGVGEVRDELNLLTGELTQRIHTDVLDGKEKWVLWIDRGDESNVITYYYTVSNTPLRNIPIINNKITSFDGSNATHPYYSTKKECIAGAYNVAWGRRIAISINKDTATNVSSLKTWLAQNPITIQYQLATESVKTIDLQVTDQNGKTIPHIQTQPTVTHITASSDYLIPTVTIDNNLSYETIIKPSTLYTVRFKHNTVNADNPLTVDLGGTTQTVTSTEFTITTPSELTHNQLVFSGKNNVVSEVQVIEGNVTNVEYPFFEGMNDVKSPKMVVTGKNLFPNFHKTFTSTAQYRIDQLPNGFKATTLVEATALGIYNNLIIDNLEPNTIYTIGAKITISDSRSNNRLRVYDIDTQKSMCYVNAKGEQNYQRFIVPNSGKIGIGYYFISNALPSGATTHPIEPIGLQITYEDITLVKGDNSMLYEPYHEPITVQQDVDSIPLTSDMFEQNGYGLEEYTITGTSLQQLPSWTSTERIKTKSLIKVKPNTQYNCISNSIDSYALYFDKDGLYIGRDNNIDTGVWNTTFRTSHNTRYIAICLRYKDESAISPSDLDSMNLILQEVPQEIVLRGIGDVKDELDLTRGEYIQRIYDYTFTGEEEWYSWLSGDFNSDDAYAFLIVTKNFDKNFPLTIMDGAFVKDNDLIISNLLPTSQDVLVKDCSTEGIVCRNADPNYIGIKIKKDKIGNYDEQAMKAWVKSLYNNGNPLKIQFALATPIIHKVNLTNTKVIPSYATETHYETITPSDSLIPNITIPSTLNYDVAIKPSTEYTIRANTSDNLTVDLGGTTGTLSNGKVTLTTPATLTHNEVKFSGTGKVKKLMVVEGNEIKDNVPFFNGMKDVQMGGIKLVNIARGARVDSSRIVMNTNKTQFTYTSTGGSTWCGITFDTTLFKPNTLYTIYMNIITNTLTGGAKISLGHSGERWLEIGTRIGIYCETMKTTDRITQGDLGILIRPNTQGQQLIVKDFMIFEGDWTHLDEIPYIESEMIIEQPIIRSQGKNLFDYNNPTIPHDSQCITKRNNGFECGTATVVVTGMQGLDIKKTYTISFTVEKTTTFDSDGRRLAYAISQYYEQYTSSSRSLKTALASQYKQNEPVRVQFTTKNVDKLVIQGGNGFIYSNIQIEEDTTATSYEPYKHQTLYSNRVIGYEEGVHYGYGDGVKYTNANYNSVMADVEGLSIAYVTNGSSNFTFWDKDGAFISGKGQLDTALSSTDKNGFIVVPTNAKYMKFASSCATGANTDYTKATVTGELPLRSLPNGVCDTLNLVTGEYVQRVGEVVLDGSHPCTNDKTNGTLLRFNMFSINSTEKNMIKVQSSLKCDKLPVLIDVTNNQECIHNGGSDNYKLMLWIDSSHLTTVDVDGFRQYLSQNPITVQYELATPIVRKLGFTTKGNYTEQTVVNVDTMVMDSYEDKHYRMKGNGLQDSISNSPIFTNNYNVRYYPTEIHGDYSYISQIGSTTYINLLKNGDFNDTVGRQWLSQNPIKVGYISTNQSSESYSNIHKPIFFNDVNVKFLEDNIDIQPQLTFQARTRNSYVMDMMKSNIKYTIKIGVNLASSSILKLDGSQYTLLNNRTFISPSNLTNKVMIIPLNVHELMIIEGDVTGKNLPYFKGILSSYHDVDEIELYSVSKNLFDINNLVRINSASHATVIGNSVTFNCIASFLGCGDCWIPVEIGENYTISVGQIIGSIGAAGARIEVRFYNSLPTPIESGTLPNLVGNALTTRNKITTTALAKYMRITISNGNDDVNNEVTITNIQVEKSSSATSYIPHAHNTTLIEMPTRLETVKVVRPELTEGALEITNGAECTSTTEWRSNFIPVQPNEFIKVKNGSADRLAHIDFYDINKNFISYSGVVNATYVPDNCYFIRFFMSKSNCSDLTITRQAWKPIQLNSLPNGVCDEIIMKPNSNKAQLVQRVGKGILCGNLTQGVDTRYRPYSYLLLEDTLGKSLNQYTTNIYATVPTKVAGSTSIIDDNGGQCIVNNVSYDFGVREIAYFPYSTVTTYKEMQRYTQENPITVYYELATPIIHEIQLKGYPHVYENGTVTLNTDTPHQTLVSYNVNQEQLINTQNETIIRHDQQIDDLYYYIEMYLEEIYQMELFRMKLELSL